MTVSFVRLDCSLDAVSLVRRICMTAQASPHQKRTRYVKRMTPMTYMRKTLGGGLEQVCAQVLPLHFDSSDQTKKASTPP